MLRLARTRPSIEVVNDQKGSPTSAPHLAGSIWIAVQTAASEISIAQMKQLSALQPNCEGGALFFSELLRSRQVITARRMAPLQFMSAG